jgi:phage terminase Nu1 subunit (DNA packaging protein)
VATASLKGRMSVSAFARLRGVSHTAVQQRIKAGALPTGAKRIKGRWWIVDAARATAEWDSHTRPWVSASGGAQGGPGGQAGGSPLADATLRERKARAWAMELELARKTRELVPAREVELRWAALVVAARTALLGVPSRFKQRCPHVTAADLLELDRLLREALEELAPAAPAGGAQAS